jgi:hypothetical protein
MQPRSARLLSWIIAPMLIMGVYSPSSTEIPIPQSDNRPGNKDQLVVPAAFYLHGILSWLVAHLFVPGSPFDFHYTGVGAEIIGTADLMVIIVPIVGGLLALLYLNLFRKLYPRLPAWLQAEPLELSWKDLGLTILRAAISVIWGLIVITWKWI